MSKIHFLSFGSEKIVDPSFDNCYRVYFGHHGDEGAMKSDLVLPTPLFTEKNDYANSIEPSHQGGEKIAKFISYWLN